MGVGYLIEKNKGMRLIKSHGFGNSFFSPSHPRVGNGNKGDQKSGI